ncbi:MAG TPA: helix-turn-helix domain-containing protein [Pilimelia sp.]|nr:helix-turn-helix domain-containing protein [Pilimelia sp.]
MNDQRSDRVWHALRDSTRRRLLDLMRERPRTTGELCAAVPELSRVNVIKHLKLLEEVDLVRVQPQGRERWNHLNVVPLQEITERWIRPFEAQWAGRLWRLRSLAEEGVSTMDKAMDEVVRIVRVDQRVHIDADRARVWDLLTRDPGVWWGSPYVISEDRVGLRLDLSPGGLLWEDWGDGQGCAWATVRGFRRPERLELAGTFMMPGAVSGSATFELSEDGAGTVLRVHQTALGSITDHDAGRWHAGWNELLGVRLKALAERAEQDRDIASPR